MKDDKDVDVMVSEFIEKKTGRTIDEWLMCIREKQEANRLWNKSVQELKRMNYDFLLLTSYVHSIFGPSTMALLSINIDAETLDWLYEAEHVA